MILKEGRGMYPTRSRTLRNKMEELTESLCQRAGRTGLPHKTGTAQGGGVCLYVNTRWCKTQPLISSYELFLCAIFICQENFHNSSSRLCTSTLKQTWRMQHQPPLEWCSVGRAHPLMHLTLLWGILITSLWRSPLVIFFSTLPVLRDTVRCCTFVKGPSGEPTALIAKLL